MNFVTTFFIALLVMCVVTFLIAALYNYFTDRRLKKSLEEFLDIPDVDLDEFIRDQNEAREAARHIAPTRKPIEERRQESRSRKKETKQ